MADVFAEIDEIMHQERLTKIWHDNKVLFITFIAASILGTAATSSYRAWDTHVKTSQTENVLVMLEAENYPTNILEMEELKLRSGLRGVTLLNAAGAFMDKGEKDKALALYQRAAADKALPVDTRDLAILMSVRLLQPEADSALETLNPIIKNSKSPWRVYALLDAAIINAHGLNDYSTAIAYLDMIQEETNIPDTLFERTRALRHIYSLKQQEQ